MNVLPSGGGIALNAKHLDDVDVFAVRDVVRDLDVSTSGSSRSQGDNEQRRPGAARSAFPLAGDAGDDQGPAAPVRRSVLGLVDVLA